MDNKDLILEINHRFDGLYNIVATRTGLYRLEDNTGKRLKPFKEFNKVINGGSVGYWINSKWYSCKKLTKLSYKSKEVIEPIQDVKCPF